MTFCPTLRRSVLGHLVSNSCYSTRLTARHRTTHAQCDTPEVQFDTALLDELIRTGLWSRNTAKKAVKHRREVGIDTKRVNIVSDKLCDDVYRYIKRTLQRHKGCDLIDINPGTGLWSKVLNNALEPRNHLLLDGDADFYEPYLGDLVSRPNVKLIKKSGIVWENLEEAIQTHLPHQHKRPKTTKTGKQAEPQRNDTLLVTGNLAMSPKRSYGRFESVSTMVLYQLLSSIRKGKLLQEYGLVRLLIWINDEDKRRILPRSLSRRRRSAFEAELSCEWLHEVCGSNLDDKQRIALRDDWLNIESCATVVARMTERGLTMPEGRQTELYEKIMANRFLRKRTMWANSEPAHIARPFIAEIDSLRDDIDAAANMDPQDAEMVAKRITWKKRLSQLTRREAHEESGYVKISELMKRRLRILKRFKACDEKAMAAKLANANASWNASVAELNNKWITEFARVRDNFHLYRQQPPVLLWDRRLIEPLLARSDEFYPAVPVALLDIQPKAPAEVLRQYGAHTPRGGEISDLLLNFWWVGGTLEGLAEGMDRLWGGFGSEAYRCPSFTDRTRGGSPITGHGQVSCRAINEAQWLEILDAWQQWPFRPSYTQLLSRWSEEANDEDSDKRVVGSASGSMLSF